jgi:hypothetical protein
MHRPKVSLRESKLIAYAVFEVISDIDVEVTDGVDLRDYPSPVKGRGMYLFPPSMPRRPTDL